jgi:hypothetical protein
VSYVLLILSVEIKEELSTYSLVSRDDLDFLFKMGCWFFADFSGKQMVLYIWHRLILAHGKVSFLL